MCWIPSIVARQAINFGSMKSYNGCWTCRLRKKRCDETRPACRNCSVLEITCHFDHDKPSWMDSGMNQKQKAEEVKREVRSATARRRGTMPTQFIELNTVDHAEPPINNARYQSASLSSPPSRRQSTPQSDPAWSYTQTPSSIEPASNSGIEDPWNGLEAPSINSSLSEDHLGDSELDRRFMMFYFDNFFPFLFPFYKPRLLEGGRSWIIEATLHDEAMRHTTLCLSTYFLSVALDGAASGQNVCKTLAWEKLVKQMSVTFAMLEHSLDQIALPNKLDSRVHASRVMSNIIQLQRFEIAIGNFENCRKHLDASVAVFEQIFQATQDATESSSSHTFFHILRHMGQPIWEVKSQQRRAWSSNQAAFRFYSALLIFDDIITSTCHNEAPQLIEYHSQLLMNDGGSDGSAALNLEDFVGCENWVMLQISEISTLGAWKKSMKGAGQLDVMELVARASTIKQTLLSGLARLDITANKPKINPLGFLNFPNDFASSLLGDSIAFVTRIWAHAALLYLSITVSGWQPASASIRENVARISTLMENMPALELLRTMVWPFCIAGCLAEPGEEDRFRVMADALVPRRLYGSARKAQEIMETTWKRRDELTIDTDFAACVRSLGYVSLLV
jgi:hypothetical protein